MYEGIKDIFQLLDNGRLKEALTQLQAISMQTNQWALRNHIESTLTAYGYMLQYAKQGMTDPTRKSFYQQTLRTAYELTDATNVALMAQKTSTLFYDRIRTFTVQPPKTYAEIQLQLEAYTEDISTVPLLYHDENRRQQEINRINQTHESAITELFDKTWTSVLWTDQEAQEATGLLHSVLVNDNDIAIMISAATMSLLRVFDANKLDFLMDAYKHNNPQISQRAIVGMVIVLCKHTQRIQLYPTIVSRLSLLCDEEDFRKNLYTIQMQLLITRETSKIDKKMREEIIPEMIKNSKKLNNPKFRFEESEDAEDRNPEWEEWMDKSGLTDKIKELGEWQMAGADVYLSSFAQLKHYSFFNQMVHWFYPFDMNLPLLAPLKKDFDSSVFSPLRLIASSDYFCNSDKYSFCLAMLGMPKAMKDMSIRQMEEQAQMNEEQRDKLEQLMQKQTETKGISRQYIQDLYRFFKLWMRHHEEEDIFLWKFDLWENQLLGNCLQQDNITKELADYLFEKEYLEEAYSLYQKLMNAHTTSAEIYQKAGYIQQKQKHYAKAIQHYNHADILQPENVWTNKHLAQCYKLEGNIPQALAYYRKVEAANPDNLNTALQIGQCLARMENYAEALSYFYKVEYLEKNPNNARRAIAWCSFVTRKFEEALKYYHLIVEESSPKAEDWINIGHVQLVCGNMQEAIHSYQKAQSFFGSHNELIDTFMKDKEDLLRLGMSEEELAIALDLLL